MENNTTNQPIVSVIMPAYNSSRYIAEAIESVISQTMPQWELLIADDMSTDDTLNIVRRYTEQDSRIILLTSSANRGSGVARNMGIQQARGRYIAFLDSDDRWLPTKLEKQLELMQQKNCQAVYSSYFTCNDEGEINGIIRCRPHETAFSIKCDDKMGHLTFMYDTQLMGKVLMPHIRKRQDWICKMLIMEKCRDAYGVQEPLAIYRHTNDSISSRKLSLIRYNIQGYTFLGWSRLKSAAFFLCFFMPCHLAKRLNVLIHKKQYKQYL